MWNFYRCAYWSHCKLHLLTGFNGHLRLLHFTQFVCYAEHGSGRPNRSVKLFLYNCLTFHPQKPTLLFCQWYTVLWQSFAVKSADIYEFLRILFNSCFPKVKANNFYNTVLKTNTYEWFLYSDIVWQHNQPIKIIHLKSQIGRVLMFAFSQLTKSSLNNPQYLSTADGILYCDWLKKLFTHDMTWQIC